MTGIREQVLLTKNMAFNIIKLKIIKRKKGQLQCGCPFNIKCEVFLCLFLISWNESLENMRFRTL